MTARACLLVLVALLTSCASKPFAGRVTIVDFAEGQATRLSLASRTHMTEVMGVDPVDWFSSERDSVELKMADDEVLRDLAKEIQGLGFEKLSEEGTGPKQSAAGITSVVEVESKGVTRFLATSPRSEAKRLEAASKMKWAFIQRYNQTVSLQSVSEQYGADLFEDTQKKISSR